MASEWRQFVERAQEERGAIERKKVRGDRFP